MKYIITKTTLPIILALLIMATSAYSQNNAFSGVQNMGALLNSDVNDQNLTLSPNGLSLYFASSRAPSLGGQDIFVSQRANLGAAWGAPQHLAMLSSTANEAVMSFSLDGKTMILQSTREDLGGLGDFDLYISTRTNANDDFGWSAPVNLGAPVNSELFDSGACYFEDPATGEGTLFFSSSRNGTPGVTFHLYQSTRNTNGTFNEPTLIPELTVGGAELRLTIRRDGLEIFFGATLPPAMPGDPPNFDIYRSTRASISSAWNAPELVLGLNTPRNDQAPTLSPDGSILYFNSNRTGGFGATDLYAATRCSLYAADAPCGVNRPDADFDGDGRTDISIFRPSDGTWWVMRSGSNTVSVQQFGATGDKIVPGDYEGDGRTDMAVFRPSTATWWILRSSDNSFSTTQFGLATDKPVPADYDGDGKTDIAVYRDGTWYILHSSSGKLETRQFGLSSDIPVAGANVQ